MRTLTSRIAEVLRRQLESSGAKEGRAYGKGALVGWIVACVKANKGKSKLWNMHQGPVPLPVLGINAPDGFSSDGCLVNFTSVLLQLAHPLLNLRASTTKENSILHVQPCYARVTQAELGRVMHCNSGNTVCLELHDEATLLPFEESNQPPTPPKPREQAQQNSSITLSTELFFAVHTLLRAGPLSLYEKFIQLNR